MNKSLEKTLRLLLAVGLYTIAFTILKDDFLIELIAIISVILGAYIQNE